MAASKLHLKNVDKSYKLKKTDKKTSEGKDVFINTVTGEEHSEISITLEMPEGSGNWINVPSLINGRVYNVQGVLDMLKAGKIEPNSTGHASEDIAVEAAIYRSNNLQDNVGVPLKANNEVIVRAKQPPYTSGSGANADILAAAEAALGSDQQTQRLGAIMDNQVLEKQDDYYKYYPNSARNTDPNFSGTPQPERISERATQYLEPEGSARAARERAIGQSMESYGNRTGGVNPLNSNTMLAEGSPNGRGINYSREYINPLRNMVDLSNIESLTDNGAPGSEFDVNKRMGAAMSSYGERIGEDAYRENLMNDAMQSYGERTGMSTGAAAAVERKRKASLEELASIMDRADAEKEDDYFDVSKRFTNRWGDNALAYSDRSGSKPRQNDPKFSNMTISAADQAMFDAASKARGFSTEGPKTRQSNKPGVNAKNLNPDEQMQNSYNPVPDMMSDGPSTRGRNRQKPIFNFSMRPEEKMNDARSLKGLTPDYGKMPGFKLPTNDKGETNGNYWSADENSDFWKTDAGYQKAQETWGQNLPTFVKKPQRKDIDIDAIKKFFTSSR